MSKPKPLEELLVLPDSCTIRELPLLEQAAEMARRLGAVAKKAAELPHNAAFDSGTCFRCRIERALNGESE